MWETKMWGLHPCKLTLLVACFIGAVSSLYLGDICHHKAKNMGGVCKLLTDCNSAITDIHKGIYPQNCGFIQSAVIVCCPENEQITITTPSQPVTFTSTTSKVTVTPVTQDMFRHPTSPVHKIDRSVPGVVSRAKCKEYEKLAYEEEIAPSLLFQLEIIKIEKCPWALEPTISGGTKTKLGEFTHMALLKYRSNLRCGGTLISEKFVLTAAHCVDKEMNTVPISVRLGDLNISDPNDDKYVQEIDVKQVHVHPNYKYPVQYNDIALIELQKPAVLSEYLKPACLYTSEITFDKALVTGWGRTEEHVASDHLLKALLNIFSQESCNKIVPRVPFAFPKGINHTIEICAGSLATNKDTCGGDSGGPLQIYSNDFYCSHYLLGVTSLGIRCGEANYPAVYTKIYPYLGWIESIVWPE